MTTAVMTEGIAEASPRFKARIAGVFHLLTILTGAFAVVFAGRRLFVYDAANLIAIASYIAVILLFYDMFKPVNRSLSLLAAFFNLAGCIIQALSSLLHLAPLVVLGGGQYLRGFKVEQLQALALMFLNLRAQATSIYMVFFGCYCLLIGYLIFRSTFLPRILGVFMAIAGLSYQIFLSPPLANYLFPYIVAPAGALGELSLILWLLVMGVNPQRWKAQASAAEMRI